MSEFFSELKRRNVVRVAMAHAVGRAALLIAVFRIHPYSQLRSFKRMCGQWLVTFPANGFGCSFREARYYAMTCKAHRTGYL